MHAATFITVLFVLLAAAVHLVPPVGEAQQASNIPRIGLLSPTSLSDPRTPRVFDAFRHGLRNLGYVEGQNIAIESRWAEGQYDRPPDLAAELVGKQHAQETPRTLGIRLQSLEVRGPGEIDDAFAAITTERAGAVIGLAERTSGTSNATSSV